MTHEWDDNLAIGVRLEVIWLLQALSDQPVVVDLAVDGQNDAIVRVGQGLGAAVCSFVRSTVSCSYPPSCMCAKDDVPTPTILKRSWHRTVARRQ